MNNLHILKVYVGRDTNGEPDNPIFFGLFVIAIGLIYVGIAIWGSEAGFHAPRWVVGLALYMWYRFALDWLLRSLHGD